MLCFFFFKQKTAYEMRISDWSSDVCSSDLLRSANSFSTPLRAANANANLSFPLYQGGRVKNSIRAADARVESGRANLRFTEADVFPAIVSVSMDVMRDAAIVELNRRNVAVLETNLQASRARFEMGDLTRTDVAQSEARLAVAQGQLEKALRSEERRVGKEGVSTGRSRWAPDHKKKK